MQTIKDLMPVLAGIALTASAAVSCASYENDPGETDIFGKLPPGLYVTTVDTLTFTPRALDAHLYIGVNGGFFARGVNVYPEYAFVKEDTWRLDSVYWTQIDTVIKADRPSKPIEFDASPWEVDVTYKPTDWLWVERAVPRRNPGERPMIVKMRNSDMLCPREIRLFLSQSPYMREYPVTQFGLHDGYIQIGGRSVSVAALPSAEMKAVRRPDGTFAVSRR